MTKGLRRNKQGVETIAVAFTDHLAVYLRVNLAFPFIHRGRGRWRMNVSYLSDRDFQGKVPVAWAEWKRHVHRYPDMVNWWVHYVKRKIRALFTKEGTDRNYDRVTMENFYYAAIYDLLRDPGHDASKLTALRGLKAKIVRLNSSHRKRLLVDTSDQDRIAGEVPSLYHLIKTRRRQESRLIKEILDDDGILQTTSTSILKAFAVHFRKKFGPIRSNVQSLQQLTSCGLERILPEMNDTFAEPISLKEIWIAISRGKSNKAPGPDGICLEF